LEDFQFLTEWRVRVFALFPGFRRSLGGLPQNLGGAFEIRRLQQTASRQKQA